MADPQYRIVTYDGKPQYFPADATDAEISAALEAIPASNAAAVPKANTWTPAQTARRPTSSLPATPAPDDLITMIKSAQRGDTQAQAVLDAEIKAGRLSSNTIAQRLNVDAQESAAKAGLAGEAAKNDQATRMPAITGWSPTFGLSGSLPEDIWNWLTDKPSKEKLAAVLEPAAHPKTLGDLLTSVIPETAMVPESVVRQATAPARAVGRGASNVKRAATSVYDALNARDLRAPATAAADTATRLTPSLTDVAVAIAAPKYGGPKIAADLMLKGAKSRPVRELLADIVERYKNPATRAEQLAADEARRFAQLPLDQQMATLPMTPPPVAPTQFPGPPVVATGSEALPPPSAFSQLPLTEQMPNLPQTPAPALRAGGPPTMATGQEALPPPSAFSQLPLVEQMPNLPQTPAPALRAGGPPTVATGQEALPPPSAFSQLPVAEQMESLPQTPAPARVRSAAPPHVVKTPAQLVTELTAGGGLSEWDSNFLASIRDRLNAGRELTKGQDKALRDIYFRQNTPRPNIPGGGTSPAAMSAQQADQYMTSLGFTTMDKLRVTQFTQQQVPLADAIEIVKDLKAKALK